MEDHIPLRTDRNLHTVGPKKNTLKSNSFGRQTLFFADTYKVGELVDILLSGHF